MQYNGERDDDSRQSHGVHDWCCVADGEQPSLSCVPLAMVATGGFVCAQRQQRAGEKKTINDLDKMIDSCIHGYILHVDVADICSCT